MSHTNERIAAELAAIKQQLDILTATVNKIAERVISSPAVADEVLSTDEFLAELKHAGLKRSKVWLYKKVQGREVACLKHLGRPYQFLRSEKWKLLRGNHR